MSDEPIHNYCYFVLPFNSKCRHGLRRILSVLTLPVPLVHNPTTSFFDISNTIYPSNCKYIFQMDFQLFVLEMSVSVCPSETKFHTHTEKYLTYYTNFGRSGQPSGYSDSLDGPGIESRWGGEIFRPDRPWGPPSLLYNGYRVFPGGKAWCWPLTPIFSVQVLKRVELYLYLP